MRDIKTIFKDLTSKPPLMFPLVGLFHILWLLWVLVSLRGEHIGWEEMVRLGWIVGYTIFWLGSCDLRKWGAWGYMALTLLDAILFLTLKDPYYKVIFISSLFLIDGVFSFFILFFYKRFR